MATEIAALEARHCSWIVRSRRHAGAGKARGLLASGSTKERMRDVSDVGLTFALIDQGSGRET